MLKPLRVHGHQWMFTTGIQIFLISRLWWRQYGVKMAQATMSYSSVNEAIYGIVYIDGLVQERRNSSVLAMELCLSCTYPSICLLTDRANEGNNVIITKLNNKTMYIYSMVHTVRMMSWCHRNAFQVTGPLWGESTVHRWIPGNAGFIYFFYDASLNKRLNKPWGCRWFEFETIWRLSLWRQFNDPI